MNPCRSYEVGNVLNVGYAEIGHSATHVLENRAVHTLTEVELHARTYRTIAGCDLRKQAIGDRHDAGDDDLTSLLIANFAHAAHTYAQIIEHALGDRHELSARRRDLHPARCSVKETDAKDVLDAFDRSCQRRL